MAVNGVVGGFLGYGLSQEAALFSSSRGMMLGDSFSSVRLGGTFSSEANAAGGQVWTSVGSISQTEVAIIAGNTSGEINIISGVHGSPFGVMEPDIGMYEADVARFGRNPGVNVYNFVDMTGSDLGDVLNGPGTTIGAFCNSGACLARFW
jgi:hypothetical protein